MPNNTNVIINLYNLHGQLVKTLCNEEFKEEGKQFLTIDKAGLQQGIHIIQIIWKHNGNTTEQTIKVPVVN